MASATDAEIAADIERDKLGKFATPSVASGIQPISIAWLWQDFLPLGSLSLIYGTEGEGKSTLTAMIAAMATLGTLPGALKGQPTNVEIIAYEDDAAAVLVPRLVAAGADLNKIWIHGGDISDEPLTLPNDTEALGYALQSRGTKLLIIDPITDALREGLRDNNNGDVRSAIVPLHVMAQIAGVAVLGVTHPNKGATDAANKVMGSKAWRSVPRSVILYGKDPDNLDGDTRIAAVSKANYARRSAVKVRIDSVDVEGVDHPQPRASIVSTSAYSDTDVILAGVGAAKPERELTKQQQAEKLIYRLLEDGGGEIPAAAANSAGVAAGLSIATMRRARNELGVTGGEKWTLDLLPVG
jgi:hypothetical protein